MKKREYIVGDVVAVEFIKNHREGRKPVCMIEGMICFISRDYHGPFIQEQSMWHVEILEIRDKVMVVNPVQVIKSKYENQRDINITMRKLQEQYPTKKKHTTSKNTKKELYTTKLIGLVCIQCNWKGPKAKFKDSVCPNCGSTTLY